MNQFPTLLILMILSFRHLIQTTIEPITAMRQPSISQPPVNLYRSNQSLSYSLQHRQSICVCTLRLQLQLHPRHCHQNRSFKPNDIKGTDTMQFIFKHKIPKGKISTYLKNCRRKPSRQSQPTSSPLDCRRRSHRVPWR